MRSKFFSEYYHLSDYFSPPTDSARWHSPSKIPFRCALYGCVNKNFSSNIKSNSDAIICEPQVTILSLLLSGWKLGLDQPRSTFFVSTHAHTHTRQKKRLSDFLLVWIPDKIKLHSPHYDVAVHLIEQSHDECSRNGSVYTKLRLKWQSSTARISQSIALIDSAASERLIMSIGIDVQLSFSQSISSAHSSSQLSARVCYHF